MRTLLVGLLLAGTATSNDCDPVKPSQELNPMRVQGVDEAAQIGVYHQSGTGWGVYTFCHDGNRIYLAEKGGIAVVVRPESCLGVR